MRNKRFIFIITILLTVLIAAAVLMLAACDTTDTNPPTSPPVTYPPGENPSNNNPVVLPPAPGVIASNVSTQYAPTNGVFLLDTNQNFVPIVMGYLRMYTAMMLRIGEVTEEEILNTIEFLLPILLDEISGYLDYLPFNINLEFDTSSLDAFFGDVEHLLNILQALYIFDLIPENILSSPSFDYIFSVRYGVVIRDNTIAALAGIGDEGELSTAIPFSRYSNRYVTMSAFGNIEEMFEDIGFPFSPNEFVETFWIRNNTLTMVVSWVTEDIYISMSFNLAPEFTALSTDLTIESKIDGPNFLTWDSSGWAGNSGYYRIYVQTPCLDYPVLVDRVSNSWSGRHSSILFLLEDIQFMHGITPASGQYRFYIRGEIIGADMYNKTFYALSAFSQPALFEITEVVTRTAATPYNFTISNTGRITWNGSSSGNRVYLRRAGETEYALWRTSSSNNVWWSDLNLQVGENSLRVVARGRSSTLHGSVFTHYINSEAAYFTLNVAAGEPISGVTNVRVNVWGTSIIWDNHAGNIHYVYILRCGSDIWQRIAAYAWSSVSIPSDLQAGSHNFRIITRSTVQFINGALIKSLDSAPVYFSINISSDTMPVVSVTNIAIFEEWLEWDGTSNSVRVYVRHADSETWIFIRTAVWWIGLSELNLKPGTNTIRIINPANSSFIYHNGILLQSVNSTPTYFTIEYATISELMPSVTNVRFVPNSLGWDNGGTFNSYVYVLRPNSENWVRLSSNAWGGLWISTSNMQVGTHTFRIINRGGVVMRDGVAVSLSNSAPAYFSLTVSADAISVEPVTNVRISGSSLMWSNPSNYNARIYIRRAGSYQWVFLRTAWNSITLSDLNLLAGTNTVRIINSGGGGLIYYNGTLFQSANSAPEYFTINVSADYMQVAPVTNVHIFASTWLEWNNLSRRPTRIYVRHPNSDTWTFVPFSGSWHVALSDLNLQTGTNTVRIITQGGGFIYYNGTFFQSANSAPVYFTIEVREGAITPVTNIGFNHNATSLQWNSAISVETRVYIRQSNTTEWRLVRIVSSWSNSISLSELNLQKDTNYIRIINVSDVGSFMYQNGALYRVMGNSSPAYFTIEVREGAITPVTNIRFNNSVTWLQWDSVSGVSSRIYISGSSDTWTLIRTTSSWSIILTDLNLQAGANTVRIINSAGSESFALQNGALYRVAGDSAPTYFTITVANDTTLSPVTNIRISTNRLEWNNPHSSNADARVYVRRANSEQWVFVRTVIFSILLNDLGLLVGTNTVRIITTRVFSGGFALNNGILSRPLDSAPAYFTIEVRDSGEAFSTVSNIALSNFFGFLELEWTGSTANNSRTYLRFEGQTSWRRLSSSVRNWDLLDAHLYFIYFDEGSVPIGTHTIRVINNSGFLLQNGVLTRFGDSVAVYFTFTIGEETIAQAAAINLRLFTSFISWDGGGMSGSNTYIRREGSETWERIRSNTSSLFFSDLSNLQPGTHTFRVINAGGNFVYHNGIVVKTTISAPVYITVHFDENLVATIVPTP